jgi:hypothetical protein
VVIHHLDVVVVLAGISVAATQRAGNPGEFSTNNTPVIKIINLNKVATAHHSICILKLII